MKAKKRIRWHRNANGNGYHTTINGVDIRIERGIHFGPREWSVAWDDGDFASIWSGHAFDTARDAKAEAEEYDW